MTDRPILFSAPMIRALLDGRKHQTRRILKDQPGDLDKPFMMDDGSWHVTDSQGGHMSPLAVRFAKGDRLWVKETWRSEARHDAIKPTKLPRDALLSFDADYQQEPNDGCRGRTRVSIHMPRWASRLTLTVTDVRVQRLQEISEADAQAEGVERLVMDDDGRFYQSDFGTYRCGFAGVWAHINGADSWDANPWVVALTFTVERRNIDA